MSDLLNSSNCQTKSEKTIVISQSMYFPWVGMLEQIRLADSYVYYDDVQFSHGVSNNRINRIQVKTEQGQKWMTIPIRDFHFGQKIDEVLIDDRKDWRNQHRQILQQAYKGAPFKNEMLELVDRVFSKSFTTLADVARASTMELAEYFDIVEGKMFVDSKTMNIGGSSDKRVLDIVLALGGNIYVTGLGARNYMDFEMFNTAGVQVRFMQYRCIPYPQLHGEFTPYVTGLDLVANCGKEGKPYIQSEAIDWKDFLRINHE
ncbi:WbqC family protein [Leptolinea tardivitalis]|uniref:WbqC n=1 Tax=Leptolinea tardivitalis TaxID=229920 RepID=A0A0P6WKF0_9CHLR|nr:WbqC family protein [Leptolinea tardivitalis]KPL70207.1 WbqC [Leptolinea tardivitalis]GAP21742.1 WbqC-like protein family [Leptolinea tardivitalis]